MFSCLAVICALASMIACIVHADSWGQPPEVCDQHGRFYRGLDCDHTQLEGTNGTAAVCYVLYDHEYVYPYIAVYDMLKCPPCSLCASYKSHFLLYWGY